MRLIDEVVWFLRRRKYRLRMRRLKGLGGECDYDHKIITIDPGTPHKVRVLVHETLHAIRPEWSEATVLYRENQIMRNLPDEHWDYLQGVVRRLQRRWL